MIEYHRLFLHLYLFINGIKKPVLFWAWLPLLTITFVRFFYNIAYRYAPCLHSAVWYPIVTDYMYSSLLLMGIWEFLVLGSCEQYHSKHSITRLWASLDTYFFGGVYISRSGIAGSSDLHICLVLVDTAKSFCKAVLPIYTPTSSTFHVVTSTC